MFFAPLQVLTGGSLLTTISLWLPGFSTAQRLVVPAAAAQVVLFEHGSSVPVDAFPNADGSGTPLTQPMTPDADGRLAGYVAQPQMIDVRVTGVGLAPRTITVGSSVDPLLAGAEEVAHKGQASGYAELDTLALVPARRLRARPAIPVLGAWDVLEVSDATVDLAHPAELVSTQAAWGSWAVGKTVAVVGAGAAHGTLVTTITGVSGGNGVMAAPASTAVTGQRACIGTDDSAAWADAFAALDAKQSSVVALREGLSFSRAFVRMPANTALRGQGCGPTRVLLIDPAAGVAYGPPLDGSEQSPWTYSVQEGFLLDGMFVATLPLFMNANDAELSGVGVVFSAADGMVGGGQNCTLNNVQIGGCLRDNLVLDNGAGDYVFEKPELNFAGRYHLVIRSSPTAEGIGYGIPQYCYFNRGVFEARNVFAPGGTVGEGCVLITAGRFVAFNDMNFYMDSWDPADTVRAMVRIRGYATGAANLDGNYWVNGDHEFRNCTWTGPGSGVGIEHDNIDSDGNAQLFQAVLRPYQVHGHTVVAGLDFFESHASLSRPRVWGQVTLA